MIIHNPILTGSFTVNGTDVASITSSAASITAINNYTASQNILNGTYTLTSSFAAQTASFTAFTSSVNSFTASQLVLNGTYATTGSNTFKNPQTINSNLIVTGSITAQTLIVSTINVTQSFSSGSNIFGNALTNTQVFSGSVSMNPGGLFVSSSGNVGIGTTSPSVPLEVYLSGGGPTLRITNAGTGVGTGNGFHIGTDGSSPFDVAFVQNENASQVFYTNDGTSTAERLRIRSGGKVTIPSGAYGTSYYTMNYTSANAGSREWAIGSDTAGWGSFSIGQATTQGGSTFSDKIIISSAGNVGIGINSTSAKLYVLGSNEVFNVAGTSAVSAYTGYYYNTSTLAGYIGNGSSILSGAASSDFIFRSEGALVYAIGNSEKMRITSGGAVYINTTSALPGANTVLHVNSSDAGPTFKNANSAQQSLEIWSAVSSGDNLFIEFATNTSITARGSIDFNRAATLTRYNTTSDANLKNIIGDSNLEKSINILNTTKIKEFSWKEDKTNKIQIGVIAQELYQTYKGAVSVGSDEELLGTEDYKSWKVDKTAFTFHLIAGWQKHEQIIQELQAQITELKNK